MNHYEMTHFLTYKDSIKKKTPKFLFLKINIYTTYISLWILDDNIMIDYLVYWPLQIFAKINQTYNLSWGKMTKDYSSFPGLRTYCIIIMYFSRKHLKNSFSEKYTNITLVKWKFLCRLSSWATIYCKCLELLHSTKKCLKYTYGLSRKFRIKNNSSDLIYSFWKIRLHLVKSDMLIYKDIADDLYVNTKRSFLKKKVYFLWQRFCNFSI